jgi:cell division protein FtsB
MAKAKKQSYWHKLKLFFTHPLVRNKYIITLLAFIIWISFFDQNDLISQYKWRRELYNLEKDKEFYMKEIKQTKVNLDELITDNKKLEKFAREKYLMKKDDEDIFVIVEKQVEE